MNYQRIIRTLRQKVHDYYDIDEHLGIRCTNLIHNVKRHIGNKEVRQTYKEVSFISGGKRKNFMARDKIIEVIPEKKNTKKGQ